MLMAKLERERSRVSVFYTCTFHIKSINTPATKMIDRCRLDFLIYFLSLLIVASSNHNSALRKAVPELRFYTDQLLHSPRDHGTRAAMRDVYRVLAKSVDAFRAPDFDTISKIIHVRTQLSFMRSDWRELVTGSEMTDAQKAKLETLQKDIEKLAISLMEAETKPTRHADVLDHLAERKALSDSGIKRLLIRLLAALSRSIVTIQVGKSEIAHTIMDASLEQFYQIIHDDLLGSNTAEDNQVHGSDRTRFLIVHNDLRRSIQASNMRQVAWDSRLESLAHDWSRRCLLRGSPVGRRRIRGLGDVGESIFALAGNRTKGDVELVVREWFKAGAQFDYPNLCRGSCQSFINIAWADTDKLGCSIRYCPRLVGAAVPSTLFVCYYYPYGILNYPPKKGEAPYLPGEHCTACPSSHPHCDMKLCSSRN